MGQWVSDLSGLQSLGYRLDSNLFSLGLILLIQQLLNVAALVRKIDAQREVA